MPNVTEMILINLFWILVGVVITRILDTPIERYQRRLRYWWKGLRARIFNQKVLAEDEYQIGAWRAEWIRVEGSSIDPYTPDNIVCQYDPTPLVLPRDREHKKRQIDREQAEIERVSKRRPLHNGPTVALARLERGQVGDLEDLRLILHLRPSEYYNFLATAMSLDEVIPASKGKTITVRDKYLRKLNFSSPIPEFASAFAIQLNVITADGFIVISKRAVDGVVGYPGYLAPAINECINPVADRDANGTISLFATARRGATHEMNIEITEDELLFFTVGVDVKWYMYTLTGVVRSKTFTRADILARRTLGSKEFWEVDHYRFLPHNLKEIAQLMREASKTDKWSPYGIVCLTQTLAHEFGLRATEQALRKYPPF